MQFKSLILAATAATSAMGFVLNNPWSPIPGYPIGNGFCLTDDQANFVANTFKSILTNKDRQAANATAQTLIADNYVETSDSINILAGYPLGGVTFNGKKAFIDGAINAPPLVMDTLAIYHDCTHVLWQWNTRNLGRSVYPVKGFNSLTVANPANGQATANNLEFNSIAWGTDIGWTCTPPKA